MPMPYTKEQVAQANNINLIDYAAMNGYKLEHNDRKSFRINGCGGLILFKQSNAFYQHSTGKKGGPISFVMEFENLNFVEAVGHLINERPNLSDYVPPAEPVKKEKGKLVLPEKAKNAKRLFWYLCSYRGIDAKIIFKLLDEKKLYQQAAFGNCVFVGYDEKKVPRYCSKRGTSPERPYKGDQDNSDKGYPFSMEGTSNRLYVLEAPIDVMSHASLFKLKGIDYAKDHRISLGCLSDRALEWYLVMHPEIKQIIFAFDNDADGKAPDGSPCNHGQKAAKKYCEKYSLLGYDTAIQTPVLNDFNEDLVEIRKAEAAARCTANEDEQDEGFDI